MAKKLNVAIGGRIRAYRESLGMNRESFSEMIGLSPQFLAEAENGKKGLSAESIHKICSNTELSADYLVMGKMRNGGSKNPIDNVLKEMPGDYSVQYAQVLRAVNEMVLEAQKDGALQQKREQEW